MDVESTAEGNTEVSTEDKTEDGTEVNAGALTEPVISFETHPSRYRHWRLDVDGDTATVTMAVDPEAGLRNDYQLKLNSYDLGVDIELHDLVQRLRFEHPTVRSVIVTGGLDNVFCAGANIQMLAGASHAHKVNFCKFTNETRNTIEEGTAEAGQTWIAAVNGTAAGGGYELALACDEIHLVDDRSSTVSLPEVPLLAVLPGTGGLTRVVDKRLVRRDLADAFSTRTEGVRGKTAVEWNLVDSLAPASTFASHIAERAAARAAESDRPTSADGVTLTPLNHTIEGDPLADHAVAWETVRYQIDRSLRTATITIAAPTAPQPDDGAGLAAAGADSWLLRCARELDAAILALRFNEPTIGTWVLKTTGNAEAVIAAEAPFSHDPDHWLVREIRLLWTRTLKRLDLSSRTLVALVEPGGAWAGMLVELALAADRSFMLQGTWEDWDEPPAPVTLRLSDANLGRHPMSNGISRLATRFWGRDEYLKAAEATVGAELDAAAAHEAGLVTFIPDDLDWDDEVRITLEERASFSPDALTGMEANFRFVGPETLETKIFARLTAWQNWIFQRPNAVGPQGALQRFGTGSRPDYDLRRV